jgi:hypothetical protein
MALGCAGTCAYPYIGCKGVHVNRTWCVPWRVDGTQRRLLLNLYSSRVSGILACSRPPDKYRWYVPQYVDAAPAQATSHATSGPRMGFERRTDRAHPCGPSLARRRSSPPQLHSDRPRCTGAPMCGHVRNWCQSAETRLRERVPHRGRREQAPRAWRDACGADIPPLGCSLKTSALGASYHKARCNGSGR